MGFAEVLTIVFIILKLLGKIGWEWWQVLLPEIIAVAIYIILLVIVLGVQHRTRKQINKSMKDIWRRW